MNIIKNSKELSERRLTYLNLNRKQAYTSIRIFKNIISVCTVSLASYFSWKTNFSSGWHTAIIFAITFLVMVGIIYFNEIFPKVLVKGNPLKYAKNGSLFFLIILKLFKPIYKFIHSVYSPSNDLKRQNRTLTQENGIASNEGNLPKHSDDALSEDIHINVNLDSTFVKQIMVNRLDIMAVDYNQSFTELLREVISYGYSRIPVYKETIDSIEGILYVKDLLVHIEKKKQFDWHQLIRTGFFIPESKKVDDLLRDFQEKKVHMAIVVDEYGGTSGLVTLEDIIEEIVGEINDEFDNNHNNSYSKLDETTFIFEGNTQLKEFLTIYNQDLNNHSLIKEKELLGDFLLELFGRVPLTGEQITFNQFEFTVIGVDKEKINRVKVFIKDQTNKEGYLVGK